MTLEIVCPRCESDEHLRGERRDHLIHIVCESCKVSWDRDPAPRCRTCGTHDLVQVPRPLLERSRGTQMSITAMHVEFYCRTCDAEQLAAARRGHLPPALGDGPLQSS